MGHRRDRAGRPRDRPAMGAGGHCSNINLAAMSLRGTYYSGRLGFGRPPPPPFMPRIGRGTGKWAHGSALVPGPAAWEISTIGPVPAPFTRRIWLPPATPWIAACGASGWYPSGTKSRWNFPSRALANGSVAPGPGENLEGGSAGKEGRAGRTGAGCIRGNKLRLKDSDDGHEHQH